MNETDNPLKRLVKTSIIDFAEWILGKKVEQVETATIELHADPAPIFSDLIFWVTLAQSDESEDQDGRNRVLLHFEFQGRSSRKPMRLRVLDYIVRIADSERDVNIHSAVFYIGDGVGERDTGYHQLKGIGDRVTLSWHYDVFHLWKIPPEELLALNRPGLLPLIGQTKIENPDEVIPRVYAEIKSIPNEEVQHKLLTELLALLQDQEITEMVENLIEQDEWFLDTPYIRKWRTKIEAAQSQAQEAQSQAQEAQSQAQEAQSQVKEAYRQLEQARHQAKQAEEAHRQAEEARKAEIERMREIRRQDLLNLVAARYNPSLQEGLRLQKHLSALTTDEKFKVVFEAIVHVEDFEQFYMIVEQAASGQDGVVANL